MRFNLLEFDVFFVTGSGKKTQPQANQAQPRAPRAADPAALGGRVRASLRVRAFSDRWRAHHEKAWPKKRKHREPRSVIVSFPALEGVQRVVESVKLSADFDM